MIITLINVYAYLCGCCAVGGVVGKETNRNPSQAKLTSPGGRPAGSKGAQWRSAVVRQGVNSSVSKRHLQWAGGSVTTGVDFTPTSSRQTGGWGAGPGGGA